MIIKIFFIGYCLLLFYLYKKKSVLFYDLSNFLIFTLFILYQSCFVFEGLDITDEGFILSKSWFMFNEMWQENVDVIAGSSFFGGLWLHILNEPSILWARIGAILLISTNFTIIFILLKRYFEIIKAFIVVFIALTYTTSPTLSCTTINYNNLPVFLIVVSLFFVYKYFDTLRLHNLILSGIMVSFSLFSRFIFAPFLFLPVLWILIDFYKNRNFYLLRSRLLYYLLGIIIGSAIVLSILLITNSLTTYLTSVKELFNTAASSNADSHSSYNLLKRYIRDFLLVSKYLFFIFLFLLFFVFIYSLKLIRYYKFLVLSLFTLGFFLYIFVETYFYIHAYRYIILSCIFANLLICSIIKKINYNIFLLLLSSLYLIFFSFLGSDNGLLMPIYSGSSALAFSLSVLLLEDIDDYFIRGHHFNLKIFSRLILISIVFYIIFNKRADVYRDLPRAELQHSFSSEVLKSINSNSYRVKHIDSLIVNFNRLKKDEHTALSINSNPMFYFLCNQPYYLTNPWFVTVADFEEKILYSAPPNYFILTKKNPRNKNWHLEIEICDATDTTIYNYFKNYVISNHYKSVYQDDVFVIYFKESSRN